ncbi:hypothetical protein FIU91_03410 [Roseivivax sp. THAF30]|nr:hypothetical protein FIU91_03410 [Roseivivax sp. THAF30]
MTLGLVREICGGPRRVFFRRGWEAVEYLVVEDDAEEVVLEFSSGEPDPAWRRLLREQLVGNSGTLQDADAKNHGLEDPEM